MGANQSIACRFSVSTNQLSHTNGGSLQKVANRMATGTQLVAGSARQPTEDHEQVFKELFSADALYSAFEDRFATTAAKGCDRLNGFQFAATAKADLSIASEKILCGRFKFSPYLEVLRTKGRNKPPRLISVPTVRDRIVFHQLNKYLAFLFPDRVPKNVAGTYVREIATDIHGRSPSETWVCSTDIKVFYDSIIVNLLLTVISKRVRGANPIKLIRNALSTPTVPKNTRRSDHTEYRPSRGVPQGLAISNILASLYMQSVDDAMTKMGVMYYRYVDDVLMYGAESDVRKALRSLRARLAQRGLKLHPVGSGKTSVQPLHRPFGYLGYSFRWPHITVRESTVERFLQSIASKFSDYKHNKARRLEKFKYLDQDRLKEIFLLELNERITGAIANQKRYGWIAYFNQITDQTLLHRIDNAIARMFERLSDFEKTAPSGLKTLRRAYFEMRFNPHGGYVRDYDKVTSLAEMLELLSERGRVGPAEELTERQVRDRYEQYLHHVLAKMHADEGVVYG